MELDGFSPKQLRAMTWWMPRSPDRDCEAIVCDGAVRSGKTLSMGLGFFLWAMCRFDGRQFGLCGKTMGSLRRNVLQELTPWLEMLGMQVTEHYSEHLLRVRFAGRENRFYVFGGRDESAAGLIQGITFAGILMDEVVLMPRSFVEQACARCSVAGSRLWFNCNPEGPQHWFYREWIKGARRKKCLHLHFTMEDNPSLTPEIRRRYRRLYSGVFYRRFVLGLWTAAEAAFTTSSTRRRRRLCRRGRGSSGTFPAITGRSIRRHSGFGAGKAACGTGQRSFTSTPGARDGR